MVTLTSCFPSKIGGDFQFVSVVCARAGLERRVTAPVVLAPISPSFLIWDNAEHVTAYIPTPIGTGAYGGGA